MKVAVIGSRELYVNNLGDYLPNDVTEIISGGARGVDASAREYANNHKIKLTEILPNYKEYGRIAPLKRNDLIVDAADIVFAFWDGSSHGTKYVINYCKKTNKPIKIFKSKK